MRPPGLTAGPGPIMAADEYKLVKGPPRHITEIATMTTHCESAWDFRDILNLIYGNEIDIETFNSFSLHKFNIYRLKTYKI